MNTQRNRKQIYEGKAKILFEGPEPGTIIQYFKDDTTAFNNEKHAVISGKGVLNNRISEHIMTRLNEFGIPTHFIKTLNMREQLVREVEIIPLEVVVRNVAAGSLCKRLGIEEGTHLPEALVEFYYKDDALGDPLVSESHIFAFGWSIEEELEEIKHIALRVNDFLYGLFMGLDIKLVDFKLEFGRIFHETYMELVLADEISPDSCRLWDVKTNERLDKDVFRRDLGNLEDAYRKVAHRLGIIIDGELEASEGRPAKDLQEPQS
jgi:phosphoribosylaminoimidazole-succinocarboxamide synthase